MPGSEQPLIYHFPGAERPALEDVGGKALSLIETAQAKMPVPPGFVLPVSFFRDWLDELQATTQWRSFVAAGATEAASACASLKQACAGLRLPAVHREALSDAAARFSAGTLFAVRSSSPQEDLDAASFAGGYETVLAVPADGLEVAVRRAFVSCLDERVVVYKREHGFDIHDPRIAVIVQAQIASEVAGVAFSLNPVNNDYDEIVISANWGLGETVVSGRATPDSFIVDRVSMTLKELTVGSKESTVWVDEAGGTAERPPEHPDEPCMPADRVMEVAALTDRVESLYRKPMDIEWAVAEGRLFLLQARPITAYVPLSPEMTTAPGQQRRLYWDASLGAQGITKPLSAMAVSVMDRLITLGTRVVYGLKRSYDIDDTVPWAQNGRLYLVISNAMALFGKARLAALLRQVDSLTAATLEGIDEDVYRSRKFKVSWTVFGTVAVRVLGITPRLIAAAAAPERLHERCRQAMSGHHAAVEAICTRDLPLEELFKELFGGALGFILKYALPALVVSRLAIARLHSDFGDKHREDIAKLDQSLPHNVTVEMGLELHRLSTSLPGELTTDQIESGIAAGTLPRDFVSGWAAFIERYGHRGPVELDIASPRYRDEPRVLFQQLSALSQDQGNREGPLARFEKSRREREEAYERLCAELAAESRLKLWYFRRLYRIVERLGGYRETPKFYMIMSLDRLRQRIIEEGRKLVAAGRLDRQEQVFDLAFDELLKALDDQSLDLREAARRNRQFPDRLARVPSLPRLIDSRGRILRRPSPPAEPGEVAGLAIAPGVARGPVKVLLSPQEKPLNRGDILVARATDPGWTPLFVNAAGVVLEVGGMLQHGALVAREYGLPCVGGVDGAISLWEDGAMVEVDGSSGVIRRVSD